jgi:hypothetical protein
VALLASVAVLTTIAILLSGFGSVLAARGRLAANTGAYWWAWSFVQRVSAARMAVAELVLWPFVAGCATALGVLAAAAAAEVAFWPRAITALMIGVGTGALFAPSKKATGTRRRAMVRLVQRQEELLDRLAHDGLDHWLSSLSHKGLEAVGRETLRRHLTSYGSSPPSLAQAKKATQAVKATFVTARDDFRNDPDNTDLRDRFQDLIHDLVREQRFAYSRKQQRLFLAS